MSLLALNPSPVNHVGILVEDLPAAVDRFQELLGVRFRPAHRSHFAVVEEAHGTGAVELPMTYSMDGPPWFELMEATGDGVWSPERGLGLHHIGGHTSDLDAAVAEWGRAGVEPEASIRTPEGELLIVYFAPGTVHGTRIELLSEALKPRWASWVAGGPPPTHE